MRADIWAALAVATAGLTACATSHVTVGGTMRPPIQPSQVTVYSHAPPVFEEIGILDASSKSLFNAGGQRTTDKVVERLKAAAARIGANGVILEGFDQTQTGAIGTGAGSSSSSGHGSIGVGVSGAVGIFKTTGKARAIVVPAPSPP